MPQGTRKINMNYIEDARLTLISALVVSKGWMHDCAAAVYANFAHTAQPADCEPAAKVSEANIAQPTAAAHPQLLNEDSVF